MEIELELKSGTPKHGLLSDWRWLNRENICVREHDLEPVEADQELTLVVEGLSILVEVLE